MDVVKKHFEEEANEFDEIILRLIPHYAEMIDGMVNVIPFESSHTINVIDLGCGTGTISNHIKMKFPHAKITCLDLAKNMIEMSQIKLKDYSDIRYQVGDFTEYDFDEKYDVVVSSLALHHLVSDQDKIGFYNKIYKALNPGGVFFNADVILGSSKNNQEAYMGKWKSFMSRSVSNEEIESKWLPKYHEEDRPAKLLDQIAWLSDIGFSEVDVIWKYYNFAVYGGRKDNIA